LILVVATNATSSLSAELARLESDLVGDGWAVVRRNVSSTDSPASVRNVIIEQFYADPENVKAVLLFGHVPVLYSGNLNYDGHLSRPMPADAYYADVDGIWNNPNFLPSDVELMLGRVDFSNMPGNATPGGWPSETELLRNYLNKDHQWRHQLIDVPHRALMGDRRGEEKGEATAASGYRNFDPLIGHGNTLEANVEDNAPVDQRWISMLAADTYLWAYGCGGGQPTSISALGTHGEFFEVWSNDIVGQDARAAFVMMFGSFFGNWDTTDNIMRSVLATPTLGLACCMAGRPHWYFHHMALGEPIGYSARLTMNNFDLYRNQTNALARAIYIALMGDPTLRLDPVAPVLGLNGSASAAGVQLSWEPSPGEVEGYYVYRSLTPAGPFTRLTSELVTGTAFTDTDLSSSVYTYMVRAVKLQSTPSGTYYNPSQGVFVTLETTPLYISVSFTPGSLVLTWNSLPGISYHVESSSALQGSTWTDVSGAIIAFGTTTSWTDFEVASRSQRFYRVTKSVP
jgi:hypothetical protein